MTSIKCTAHGSAASWLPFGTQVRVGTALVLEPQLHDVRGPFDAAGCQTAQWNCHGGWNASVRTNKTISSFNQIAVPRRAEAPISSQAHPAIRALCYRSTKVSEHKYQGRLHSRVPLAAVQVLMPLAAVLIERTLARRLHYSLESFCFTVDNCSFLRRGDFDVLEALLHSKSA